jgi:hypothetical protein
MREKFSKMIDDPRLIASAMLCVLAILIVSDAGTWLHVYAVLTTIAILWAVLTMLRYARLIAQHTDFVSLPFSIAHDAEVVDLLQSLGFALRDVSANLDPIYRELALDRVRQLSQEATAVGRGIVTFHGTEAWRSAYEKLLRSRGLYRYRSVAYIHTPAYWQDEPGRQSMRVNYEMVSAGLMIERITVIADELWPVSERLPIDPIGSWLDEQARCGVQLRLVRASRVDDDLRTDFGLYGNRAVGRQELDDQSHTTRFTLSFDFAELLAAESRWERLEIYATTLAETLDRPTR